MNDLLPLTPGEIMVLQAPPRPLMLSLIAALAANGPLMVLDAGNQFDAYRVARLIRRHTADLDPILDRVHVARAFTCFQVVAMFERPPVAPMLHVVLDLLATFYDESVSDAESYRLLRDVLEHVRALSQSAPVVISARPAPNGRRTGLLAALIEAAGRHLIWETPAAAAPSRLF